MEIESVLKMFTLIMHLALHNDKKRAITLIGVQFSSSSRSGAGDHGLWTFSNLSQIMVSFNADPLLCPKNMIDVFSTVATVRHLSLFKDDTQSSVYFFSQCSAVYYE